MKSRICTKQKHRIKVKNVIEKYRTLYHTILMTIQTGLVYFILYHIQHGNHTFLPFEPTPQPKEIKESVFMKLEPGIILQ